MRYLFIDPVCFVKICLVWLHFFLEIVIVLEGSKSIWIHIILGIILTGTLPLKTWLFLYWFNYYLGLVYSTLCLLGPEIHIFLLCWDFTLHPNSACKLYIGFSVRLFYLFPKAWFETAFRFHTCKTYNLHTQESVLSALHSLHFSC